jgi:hypothetical protein
MSSILDYLDLVAAGYLNLQILAGGNWERHIWLNTKTEWSYAPRRIPQQKTIHRHDSRGVMDPAQALRGWLVSSHGLAATPDARCQARYTTLGWLHPGAANAVGSKQPFRDICGHDCLVHYSHHSLVSTTTVLHPRRGKHKKGCGHK